MKRPVTLLLVATLLASGAAYAKNDKESAAHKAQRADMIREHVADRRDRRDDRRDDRRNDHGRDHDRRDWSDHRGNDRGHDRRDDHRRDRDWNDHRNDGRRDRDWNDRPHHDRRHDNDRHDWDRRDNRGWDRHRSDWDRHPNYWDNRRHDRRDYARYRYHYGRYVPPRGYYYRSWHRGDRLPSAWYGRSYVVYDWRPYRLYSPPYGYHWVRVGNDVVLTAIATGIVLDVLYDIWY